MHLLLRETRSLEEEIGATDLAHAPADVLLLSFSDSDLGAAAAGWQAMDAARPSLRLANLARLRHPLSVDLYGEQTVAASRCVIVRVLGGLDYWRYGAEEFAAICRRHAIPLALLPGEDRDNPRLAELSTMPAAMRARFAAFLHEGGPANYA